MTSDLTGGGAGLSGFDGTDDADSSGCGFSRVAASRRGDPSRESVDTALVTLSGAPVSTALVLCSVELLEALRSSFDWLSVGVSVLSALVLCSVELLEALRSSFDWLSVAVSVLSALVLCSVELLEALRSSLDSPAVSSLRVLLYLPDVLDFVREDDDSDFVREDDDSDVDVREAVSDDDSDFVREDDDSDVDVREAELSEDDSEPPLEVSAAATP